MNGMRFMTASTGFGTIDQAEVFKTIKRAKALVVPSLGERVMAYEEALIRSILQG